MQFAVVGSANKRQKTKHKVGENEASRACLLSDSLRARELRSEIVDSKAFDGILLEEKILDLAGQVGRLLLRQKHLG